MEAHYFQNECFMIPNQIISEADKLAGIRSIMVQGRYDLLRPPATCWPRDRREAKCASSKAPDTSCMTPACATR